MFTSANIWAALTDSATNNVYWAAVNAGAPTNGTSGTGAGLCGPGSLLIDITNKALYMNTNTLASPTWTLVSGGSGGGGVTLNGVQTLTNKTLGVTNTIELLDTLFTLDDNADPTKQIVFQLSGITTATKRTWTFPDANDTFVGLAATQTLTGKTLTTPTLNQPITLYPDSPFAAAGSTQADGVAITYTGTGIAYVTGANTTKGAVLPVGAVGQRITVANDAAANATLKVYGNTGDSATINGVSGATAYVVAAKASVDFIFVAAAKWQTLPLVSS